MDTKLKNSKFNPIIKAIILILTLVFAFLSGTSILQLVRKTIYFNNETKDFRNTPAFLVNVENDLETISCYSYNLNNYGQNMTFEEYSKNSVHARNLHTEYEEDLEKALSYYREIQEIKKLEPVQDGTYYDKEYDLFYDKNGYEYAYFDDFQHAIEEQKTLNTNNEFTNLTVKNVYPTSPIDSYETTTYLYEAGQTENNALQKSFGSHAEWEYEYASLRNKLFSIVSDARSEDTIKTELENQLNNRLTESYDNQKWVFYEIGQKYTNIDFFIQNNTNGNYISNFENINDINNLKETYKDDALYYFFYNGKNVNSTPANVEFKDNTLTWLLEEFYIITKNINIDNITDNLEDCTVYIKIHSPEKAVDEYYSLYQAFEASKFLLATELKIQTAVFSILTLAGIITLAILSKPRYKDSNIKLTLKQRTLFIIHLVFYAAIVFLTGAGLVVAFCEDYTSGSTFLTNDLGFLVTDQTLKILIGTLLSLFALFTVNFVNYIVVNKKADTFKERFICYKLFKRFKWLVEKNRTLRQSVKQIEKKLLIIVLIWLAIELIIGFFACGFGFDDGAGILFAIILLLNTIVGIIFVLKFLSQIKILALAVEDMKNGNLDINLDSTKFVFPLKDFARNLNDCRDSIENAVSEALKGERLKTELITNVSHDLKTPLTSIINYVSLLKLCDIKGEDENKYLDILDEKSKKLQRLIEDLTEASKASSGNIKMTVDTVNLNELALQAVGENNDVLENVGLDVIISQKDSDLYVKADSQHTFRIFDNLFSNVKKYALSGTRVYVDVYKDGNYGVFSVKNISKDKLNITADEITERFVRGDNSRSTEGSGLGLSIARSFTELQNGVFSIEIDGDLFKVIVKLPITNKPKIEKTPSPSSEFDTVKVNEIN